MEAGGGGGGGGGGVAVVGQHGYDVVHVPPLPIITTTTTNHQYNNNTSDIQPQQQFINNTQQQFTSNNNQQQFSSNNSSSNNNQQLYSNSNDNQPPYINSNPHQYVNTSNVQQQFNTNITQQQQYNPIPINNNNQQYINNDNSQQYNVNTHQQYNQISPASLIASTSVLTQPHYNNSNNTNHQNSNIDSRTTSPQPLQLVTAPPPTTITTALPPASATTLSTNQQQQQQVLSTITRTSPQLLASQATERAPISYNNSPPQSPTTTTQPAPIATIETTISSSSSSGYHHQQQQQQQPPSQRVGNVHQQHQGGSNGVAGSVADAATTVGGGVTRHAVTQSPDKRPRQLSLLGLLLSMLALALAFTALVTTQWARQTGSGGGFVGLFMTCQDTYRGNTECSSQGRAYPGNMALTAGLCAVLFCGLLLVSTVLAAMVLLMHKTQQRVVLKFRHATLGRMMATAAAGFLSLMSVLLFVVEVNIIKGGGALSLSWGFYLQVVAMLVTWCAGGGSSAEWQKSRKLGGDPTKSNRDPQGLNALTFSNPHSTEDPPGIATTSPRTNTNTNSTNGTLDKTDSGNKKVSLPTPMDVHRNTNGIAMTSVSGQPYVVSMPHSKPALVNGHVANGRVGKRSSSGKVVVKTSKSPKHSRRSAGSSSNSGGASNNTFVAFDPTRLPRRPSIKLPKTQQQLQGTSPTEGPDATDGGGAEGGIPNPAFAQSSPPPKKKVRIHTQSTAV